ncbi:MAG: hypothetical protein R3Y64_09475, partial [Peptostreptococcaceae bacterium]
EGAAIYCGNIINEESNYKIIPRLSQSIGRNKNGKFQALIEKNSLYNKKSNIDWININNTNNELCIDIYQGNSNDIMQCSKIGVIDISLEKLISKIGLELNLTDKGIIKYNLYTEDDNLNMELLDGGELNG